jgi:hypothetical protein
MWKKNGLANEIIKLNGFTFFSWMFLNELSVRCVIGFDRFVKFS